MAYAKDAYGTAAVISDRLKLAKSFIEEAVEIWEQLNEKDRLAKAYNSLGIINKDLGDFGFRLTLKRNG
jgi:hypothetical protein